MLTNKIVFVELLFSCYLLVVLCDPMDAQNIQGGSIRGLNIMRQCRPCISTESTYLYN